MAGQTFLFVFCFLKKFPFPTPTKIWPLYQNLENYLNKKSRTQDKKQFNTRNLLFEPSNRKKGQIQKKFLYRSLCAEALSFILSLIILES